MLLSLKYRTDPYKPIVTADGFTNLLNFGIENEPTMNSDFEIVRENAYGKRLCVLDSYTAM